MATETLASLLATLQESVASAASSLPEDPSALHSAGGISLFDTKNELFLSYLHNLVFLILFKIRQKKDGSDEASTAWDEVVKNLVRLRLYSDKGIKPLENKLRYEIDRVIQAAEDAAKSSDPKQKAVRKKSKKAKKNGVEEDGAFGSSDEGSGSDDASEASDGEEDIPAAPATQSRANAMNIALPASYKAAQNASRESATAAYRPPRIAPTAMPTTSTEERKSRARPTKSRTMDDYINEELSGAPQAMPSIGSNIIRSGQRTQTTKERREDMERRDYEETNYVRLPALTKKEQREREKGGSGRNYGGEEWTDLGAGAERVMKDLEDGRRRTSKLEKSRKRPREEPPDAGPNGLSSFEKKRKRTLQRQRR